jgi:hypothetical protein
MGTTRDVGVRTETEYLVGLYGPGIIGYISRTIPLNEGLWSVLLVDIPERTSCA